MSDPYEYEASLNKETIEHMPIEDLRKLIAYHFTRRPYAFGATRQEAIFNLKVQNIGIDIEGYFIVLPKDKRK